MLTRLKVSGFKNLLDVDVRFGPFTCIAGVNGVGKSNLFDAIQFLSALADRSPDEAAQSIRGEGRRTNEIDSLFLQIGEQAGDRMSFEAEMIVPRDFVDGLGRHRTAKSTFLRYSVEIARATLRSGRRLAVVQEKLVSLSKTPPPFPHEKSWAGSVLFPAMLRLLQDIATETSYPVAPDNPLRQVIVNTHSPSVVAQVPEDSLLVAEPREMLYAGKRFQGVVFGSLPGTWRAEVGTPSFARGDLITYLNPVGSSTPDESQHRVVDRADLQILLPN
jgi:hypothetical protein